MLQELNPTRGVHGGADVILGVCLLRSPLRQTLFRGVSLLQLPLELLSGHLRDAFGPGVPMLVFNFATTWI
jgi:hypothetical protein